MIPVGARCGCPSYLLPIWSVSLLHNVLKQDVPLSTVGTHYLETNHLDEVYVPLQSTTWSVHSSSSFSLNDTMFLVGSIPSSVHNHNNARMSVTNSNTGIGNISLVIQDHLTVGALVYVL